MNLDATLQHFPYQEKNIQFYEAGSRNHHPTIILIHGTGGTTDKHFNYILPMLAVHQRVLSIDLYTPNRDDLEVDDFSAQVATLIAEKIASDEHITLVGYSLGAVIAAQVAAELGTRISRLILLAGWAKTSSVQQLRNHVWQTLFEERSKALPHFINYCLYSDQYLSLRNEQQVLDLARFVTPSKDAAKQRILNCRIDITPLLKEISAHTLVVACTQDRMIPYAQGKLLFAGIPNSRYSEIPSGHALYIEAPAEVVRLIHLFSQNAERYQANSHLAAFVP
jgi:pimeloyl-ACP methyl ester carboxylesterase